MRAAALTLTLIFPNTCPHPKQGCMPWDDWVLGEFLFPDLVFRGLPEVMKKRMPTPSHIIYFQFSIDPCIQQPESCISGSMSCREGLAIQPLPLLTTDSALGSVSFRLTKSLIPCVFEAGVQLSTNPLPAFPHLFDCFLPHSMTPMWCFKKKQSQYFHQFFLSCQRCSNSS